MKITLKDGSVREYAETKTVLEIAKDLSEGLARAACAGEIDGERVDLRTKVDRDCRLNILTFEEKAAETHSGIRRHISWRRRSSAFIRM